MKSITNILLFILVFFNFSYAQTDLIFKSGFEFVSQLNDTGITWSGEYPSGNLTECANPVSNPSPQDCNTGRDFTHNEDSDGHAGFSFTKLDAAGVPLADQSVDYGTTPWSCIRDNVTGLVWEVKTDDGGIHDRDNTYRWGGVTAIVLDPPNAQDIRWYDWSELVLGSNNEILCGFDNWRVPTVGELVSLVNEGTSNPLSNSLIDTNFFPNTVSTFYWSSWPTAHNFLDAWNVDFGNGRENFYDRDWYLRVRLVHSGE